MTLVEQINQDIKQAMLQKDKEKLEALRAIKSALLLLATEKAATNEENAEIKLLTRLVKQRKDAAAIYESQNRPDLAAAEIFQAKCIEAYLPQQLSEEAIEENLRSILQQEQIKQLGQLIQAGNKHLAGQAEGKTIAAIAKKIMG